MTGQLGFLEGATAWLYDDAGVERCPRCSYDWGTPPEQALTLIESSPARFEELLCARDGMAPAPDRGWNATSYVWHLGDLARGWSERWVVLASSPGSLLSGWDPDELADARNYRAMPTVSALWALSTAVATFVELTRALDPGTTFLHADWGTGTVEEALVWLAHEFAHHEIDVDERAGPPGSAGG